MAAPDDFVVVKLDIDTPVIEDALVDQILNQTSLSSLIDEFFFKHHVNMKPLAQSWETDQYPQTTAASYKLFHQLRMRGLRTHSWV